LVVFSSLPILAEPGKRGRSPAVEYFVEVVEDRPKHVDYRPEHVTGYNFGNRRMGDLSFDRPVTAMPSTAPIKILAFLFGLCFPLFLYATLLRNLPSSGQEVKKEEKAAKEEKESFKKAS
jgi:hypothetical protein